MRCGRKFGSSWSKIASILLVLLLVVSQLGAWPTRSEKTTQQEAQSVQITPEEAAEAQVLPSLQENLTPYPLSQDTTLTKSSEKSLTMPSIELASLLETLREDDNSDLADLTELRATFNEIKTLIDIQKAANKDLEEQYVADLKAKDERISQLEEDYRALSIQYDQMVITVGQSKKHDYRTLFGMSMLYEPETGYRGYGADLAIRVAGPFTITGGASFFPERSFDVTYKAGVALSF